MATVTDSPVLAAALGRPRVKRRYDPRLFQIGALLTLLGLGIARLDFDVSPWRVTSILCTALLTQYLCGRASGIAFDPRSPLITGLSLCLLLRTEGLALAALGAVLAIGSKFLVRIRGKHLFNPTNIAIVVLLAFTDGAWVSPGQWGNAAILSFWIVCMGGLVIHRSARADTTLSFLVAWAGLLFGRSLLVGEPLTIPLHRLENGALLIFAFFMISDPKTTPDSRIGRMLFALVVAAGAGYVQFHLFRTNGLLWSLALCSPLVPLLDRLLPGETYQWSRTERKPA
jgi:Na+-transporting NADH:ubiquinone oxidoreductase subunit NqrB